MPSFWKRVGLTTVLSIQIGALPSLSFAQQYPSRSKCGTISPYQPQPGQAHPTPAPNLGKHPEPPPWTAPTPINPMPGTPTPIDPMPNTPSTNPMPETPMAPMPSDPMQQTPNVPSPSPEQPSPEQPGQPPAEPTFEAPSGDALSFNAADAGIGSPDAAFGGPPNMMGDLLRAYRGITFSYLQAGDFAVSNTSGAVNFRNSKVAENNSAIPRDRASFRYNYFKNAIQVRGLNTSPTLGQRFTVAGVPFQFNQVQPGIREYDVHLYTLGLEKTLLDGMASIEVRVPFARTLDSSLDLISGVPISVAPGVVPAVRPTPDQTLGQADTELQDMNVILKAVLAQDPCQRWVVSTGLGITIPTGNDLDARVVDYSNDVPGDRNDLLPQVPRGPNQFAFDQRTRTFRIKNETWGLAPFLAAAAQPTDRTFLNGFFQIDVPLNSSDWEFRERDVDLEQLAINQAGLGSGMVSEVQFVDSARGQIDDQVLMHIDVGGGYWLYQNPNAEYIRGLAGLLELHYTTTLEDADIVVVPETPLRTQDGSGGLIGPLAAPRLGNIANRVDFLNLTMGTQIVLGRHTTLSTGYVVPLRDDLDRTFDGELNVQLNVYR